MCPAACYRAVVGSCSLQTELTLCQVTTLKAFYLSNISCSPHEHLDTHWGVHCSDDSVSAVCVSSSLRHEDVWIQRIRTSDVRIYQQKRVRFKLSRDGRVQTVWEESDADLRPLMSALHCCSCWGSEVSRSTGRSGRWRTLTAEWREH